jgi:D-alanine-D-alanine ligase
MRNARILVLFNEPVLPPGHQDAESEQEIVFVSKIVGEILMDAGFEVAHLGIAHDPALLLTELQARPVDAVFNLFEGLPLEGHTEACMASLLEWQEVVFTGSPAQALHLARNKVLTKYLLQGAGMPTPEFQVVDRLPLNSQPQRWPVIVKPVLQDASAGIEQDSVVTNPAELTNRVAYVLQHYGPPVLVEGYIPGREFNISVVDTEAGPRVLPLAEIRFDRQEPSLWPIVTYAAKWRPESHEFKTTPPCFPANLDAQLADRLRDLAVRAYRLLGCRDYARVDLRVSPAGQPYLLEVNPNPCISPDGGLAAAVAAAGQTHAEFIVQTARAALARSRTHEHTLQGSLP